MNRINGPTRVLLQNKTIVTNAYGEQIPTWVTAQTLYGWLDLSGGDSKYTTYSAKVQESTHMFLADYIELVDGIAAEKSRAVIEGKVYDIMLIDDPMEMHQHYEIYLKYTGGQ